jgi:hypothetical protein
MEVYTTAMMIIMILRRGNEIINRFKSFVWQCNAENKKEETALKEHARRTQAVQTMRRDKKQGRKDER